MFKFVKFKTAINDFKNNFINNDSDTNIPFTKNINLNKDNNDTNNNVLIIDDNNSKYEYIKQNILKKNLNYIIVDNNGKLYNELHNEMKNAGYNIQTIDLINYSKTYNPFIYMKTDDDIISFNDILYKTINWNVNSYSPFYNTEKELLDVISLYVYNYCEKKEHNFKKILELLNNYDDFNLNMKKMETNDENKVVKKYLTFLIHSGKMEKTSVENLNKKLSSFFNENILSMTENINVEENINLSFDEKSILFIKTPDMKNNDNIFLTIIVKHLIDYITKENNIPSKMTKIFLDNFDYLQRIPEYYIYLWLANKYNLSYTLFIEDFIRLKDLYNVKWKDAVKYCNTILVLNNEKEVLNYLLKKTKEKNLHNKNIKENKIINIYNNEWINFNKIKLEQDDCILFIKGTYPIIDKKI